MKYSIGLDIGISSVGWAVLRVDECGQPYKIEDLGVRAFDKAENPRDGSSLALPRRMSRGARRKNRRHRHRIERIKKLIHRYEILSEEEIREIYHKAKFEKGVYQLRSEALDRCLGEAEFVRVLIHIAQRRGFKSNLKSDNSDKERGKLLKAIERNASILEEKNYRTVGEMIYKDSSNFGEHKRNKKGVYSNTLHRDMIESEVGEIFKSQRGYGNKGAFEDFEKKYIDILFSQRAFEEGPGGDSPYGGNQIEKMLGNCLLHKEEKRAPKGTYTFERFMLLSKVNSLRIGVYGGEDRKLNSEERRVLIHNAYEKNYLTYDDVRRLLGFQENTYIKGLDYGSKGFEKVEKKSRFLKLRAYHEIRKALDKISKGYIKSISVEKLDTIAYALTVYKNNESISRYLSERGIEDRVIDKVREISFSKVGHLSLKAMRAIMPYMEEGCGYEEACVKAGYEVGRKSNENRSIKIPSIDSEIISSKVVLRAFSQSIKVINAITRKYGEPYSIYMELHKEIFKNFNERRRIEMNGELYKKKNQESVEEIRKLITREVRGTDIVKFKLYKEQQGICLYSGDKLDERRIFENGYVELDDIIPYSISLDDSYSNKVLVKLSENRQKGNRMPLEYMKNDEEKTIKFTNLVKSSSEISSVKKQKLLKRAINEEEISDIRINDKRAITKIFYDHINDNMKFSHDDNEKKVYAFSNSITSYVKRRWVLRETSKGNILDYPLKAVIVGCITEKMIKRIIAYSQKNEYLYSRNSPIVDPYTGDSLHKEEYNKRYGEKFPLPWEKFSEELKARLSDNPMVIIRNNNIETYYGEEVKPIFVSRMVKRKHTGQAHMETIRSPKVLDEGYTLVKTSLDKLKLDKDGEIKGYYNPQDDRRLYEALRERLKENGGNGALAFKDKFHKPTKSGKLGPIVNKVKVREKCSLGVLVNGGRGVAENGAMVRVDVYSRDGKFYLVPIYVSDMKKKRLPKRAIVAHKPYGKWLEMRDEEFLFSLYGNDLIWFKHRTGVKCGDRVLKEGFVYYLRTGIATGSISVMGHDGGFEVPSLGVQGLMEFEKWSVDVLGEYGRYPMGVNFVDLHPVKID